MTLFLRPEWGHLMVKNICQMLTKAFFKERTLIGAQRCPAYGPIIYFGNHSNQFVDAAVFITSLPRYPRFLIASSSLTMPVIGDISRLSGAIPVFRAGDSEFKGMGKVKVELISELPEKEKENGNKDSDETTTIILKYKLTGEGTSFILDKLKFKDELKLTIDKVIYKLSVLTVEHNDDTDVLIASCTQALPETIFKGLHGFRCVPKVDQSIAYQAVTKTLAEGSCIGIFPEGGSHDNKTLLPLKPGIAVMALNAAVQGIHNIMLVPCGIHYSNPSKPRSTYTVEINQPIVIKDDLVAEYKRDKFAAVAKLMKQVKERLEEVTITALDQDQFETMKLARDLYPPEGHVCRSREVQTEMYHIFERCFREYRDRPEMQELFNSLLTYRDLLIQYGMKDQHVICLRLDTSEALIRTIEALPSFLYSFTVATVTSPMWGPSRLVSSIYANKKRQAALKKSSVKIRGEDVLASNKLIFMLCLLPVMIITISVAFGIYFYGSVPGVLFSLMMGSIILPVYFYFGIKEADYCGEKWDTILNLLWTVQRDLVTWRQDTNILIRAREETVLQLRRTMMKFLSEDTQFAKSNLERLTNILPSAIIEADNERVSRIMDPVLSESVLMDLITFNEEIL